MLTQAQKDKLTVNPNVVKCGKSSITYTKEFKIFAVKKYLEEGYPPSRIFLEAGFTFDVMAKGNPKTCLKRWKKLYNKSGIKLLEAERRGKIKKKKPHKPQTIEEKIKYLETKVAYLEAENDFLAKLRGLKRE